MILPSIYVGRNRNRKESNFFYRFRFQTLASPITLLLIAPFNISSDFLIDINEEQRQCELWWHVFIELIYPVLIAQAPEARPGGLPLIREMYPVLPLKGVALKTKAINPQQ